MSKRNDELEAELFLRDDEIVPDPDPVVPLRTWMYSAEYPGGVIFVVTSPEYKQCVQSGEWYNRPMDREQGVPAVDPDTCYGRHLVDWTPERIEYDDPVGPEVGFAVEVPELEAADGETLKAILASTGSYTSTLSFDVQPEPVVSPPRPKVGRGRRR